MPSLMADAVYDQEVINGGHVILYSRDAEADRAFFRDVLGYPHVDAGGGWLIFKAPPGEVAVHPTEGPPTHEFYLMCDDLAVTMAELSERGVEFTGPASDRGWGLLTSVRLPGGGQLGLYEPRHPIAHSLPH
jgi:catechol 2,3-dioxygenase-like lactoylglutathione lyase family enzyme